MQDFQNESPATFLFEGLAQGLKGVYIRGISKALPIREGAIEMTNRKIAHENKIRTLAITAQYLAATAATKK